MAGTRRRPKASEGFSARDELAALGLARGMGNAGAAKFAKMGETTLYARLKDPAFNALVASLRDRFFGQTVALLIGAGPTAAAELLKLIRDEDPKIRLDAIRLLFGSTVSLGTYREDRDRFRAIEEALKRAGLS